jgi:hypothetical protein
MTSIVRVLTLAAGVTLPAVAVQTHPQTPSAATEAPVVVTKAGRLRGLALTSPNVSLFKGSQIAQPGGDVFPARAVMP